MRRPGAARWGGAILVLALSVAAVPAVAHEASAGGTSVLTTSRAATDTPARLPDVTRTNGAAPLIAASRPIKHRQSWLDLTLVAIAVMVFGGFRRRANLRSGERFRYDAIFAHRRGPPFSACVC